MSKIGDASKNNARIIEQAKRRNSVELRNIENNHVDRKAALKKYQDEDIAQIQTEHHRHLNAEAEKKEKILENMRDHLQKSEKMNQKQLKELEVNSEKEKNGLQTKLSADRERIKEEHEVYLADMNDTFNDKARDIHSEGEQNIASMALSKKREYADQSNYHQNRINQQNEEFTDRFRRDAENNKQIKDLQDRNFKKERAQTNLRQSIEMNKMTKDHRNHTEKSQQEFQKNVKLRGLDYEKAYQRNYELHQSDLNNLKATHQAVVKKLKDGLSSEVTKSVVRSDDPFYQITDVRPRLSEFEDRVEISVDIPEYAKQDMRLTMNGKDAILNFSRRFADSHRNSEGMLNSVNKVESFTTKITTSMILDPKSVKSSYENGVMTYTVKKA